MTVKEKLETIATTNQSSEEDATFLENLLHKLGFPFAKVIYGIVYLEGKGTLEAPPTSIHSIAQMILKTNS